VQHEKAGDPPIAKHIVQCYGRRGGRQALVIVSHSFWQRALGGDPRIIGKTLMIDLIPYKVIGVLDRDFGLPFPSDLFVPWPDDELRFQRGRMAHEFGVFGRMKPGVTAAQAAAELNTIQTRLRAAAPRLASDTGRRPRSISCTRTALARR